MQTWLLPKWLHPIIFAYTFIIQQTKNTLSLNIQIVISWGIYVESFYEVAGNYINPPSVLFFEQKVIKIPDSLQNLTFAERLNALHSRFLISRLWIHATQDGEPSFCEPQEVHECVEADAESHLGN